MPAPGPDLSNPSLYECRPGVPILDVHERNGRVVDRARLELVCRNSNARAARGELGLMLLGHTDDHGKEADQPPVVGYSKNYRMGEHNGRPCILGDLFYEKSDAPRLMKNFPRRSAEVFYSDQDPSNNYIDGLALLVRAPARELGLVTYASGKQKERYSMADADSAPAPAAASPEPGVTAADAGALQDYMKSQQITDLAVGIAAFLQAKAEGTLPMAFGKEDIPALQQYAREHDIDLNQPGEYEATVQRYKADRLAGTLSTSVERYRR